MIKNRKYFSNSKFSRYKEINKKQKYLQGEFDSIRFDDLIYPSVKNERENRYNSMTSISTIENVDKTRQMI
jgi:hypothetical protein